MISLDLRNTMPGYSRADLGSGNHQLCGPPITVSGTIGYDCFNGQGDTFLGGWKHHNGYGLVLFEFVHQILSGLENNVGPLEEQWQSSDPTSWPIRGTACWNSSATQTSTA